LREFVSREEQNSAYARPQPQNDRRRLRKGSPPFHLKSCLSRLWAAWSLQWPCLR